MTPQLVSRSIVDVLSAGSFNVGLGRCCGPLGFGAATFSQPAASVAGAAVVVAGVLAAPVVVVELFLPSLPQPAASSASTSAGRARRAIIARENSRATGPARRLC